MSKIHSLGENYFTSTDVTQAELVHISQTLGDISKSFIDYQSAITNQPWFIAIIGSMATLAGAWLYDLIKELKNHKKFLYFIHTSIEEQINLTIEMEDTLIKFKKNKIQTLLTNIDNNPASAWSVERIFLPKFSSRPLSEKVIGDSTGSGYVDTKLGIIYRMSRDFPVIIEDLHDQLEYTFRINESIAFGKMNNPELQKKQFKKNIKEYDNSLESDMLNKNIPLYLIRLSETIVAHDERIKIGSIGWKLKFDLRFRFYLNKSRFETAKLKQIENMDAYFKSKTLELQNRIDTVRKKGDSHVLLIKDYKTQTEI